ncbi:MAG TPA: hypothetical protein PK852_02540 [Mesotoga prima]|uniref:hypothetical protein n=1 Tax=Mesotoga prima TaxID=1184387 RepID=UPI002C0AED21|nr:hypothetical protein [Mesotoga prima]HPE52973.1 hypothetical protein [Mesotoga prima]
MKRFIVEFDDDENVDRENLREALYHCPDVRRYDVYPIVEEHKFSNGERRMTTQQRDRLWSLCGGYNVPFHEDDYHFVTMGKETWVEGWIGGKPGTIYVGVSPTGRSHS